MPGATSEIISVMKTSKVLTLYFMESTIGTSKRKEDYYDSIV